MKTEHFDNLDILRGLAALIVLFSHGRDRMLWDGPIIGQLGVSLFFTLSGFLMGYLYLNKTCEFRNVIKYIVSRSSRIAPAYLSIVIFSYLLYQYFDSSFVYRISDENILRHLLFSGNVGVFWTIPPEVQFYVYFIFVWYAVSSLRSNQFSLFFFMVILTILLMCISEVSPGTSLPFTIHFFLLGCISGILRRGAIFTNFSPKAFLQLTLLFVTLIVGVVMLNKEGERAKVIFDFFLSVPFAFLCALTVFFFSFKTNLFGKATLNCLLIKIGKCSFSLYLVHEIILYYFEMQQFGFHKAVNIILCFFLSISFSYLFYRVYENPLNIKLKFLLNQCSLLKCQKRVF